MLHSEGYVSTAQMYFLQTLLEFWPSSAAVVQSYFTSTAVSPQSWPQPPTDTAAQLLSK